MRIITGKARGLKLTVPKNMDVRPTADRVKESLFNIIGTKIIGARVLDLFAGTGNLGLEAWSRGAAAVTFIDESRESLRLVQSNISKCHAEDDVQVIKGSAVKVIESMHRQDAGFDFAFCDPPYNKGWVQKVLLKLELFPILDDGGYLIVEHAKHDEIGSLAACFELVRQETYGETLLSFIRFAKV
ncbi:16S rRNA (guanine(966)-N(2))-methyltransferase RsmD [uncultured Phascolarctobacterium sp.]|uniref:16S rRNA (guanine(966)-N(2))-methyltransferase RsmD n=1 Tax=uncultured Phascolarctobacterium sp. TaxID=512296 RepID=UPI002606DD42|nr:16S rRNA (guanine(966)-N(2))-methyltransferase RsmD [uncultured Phascolarctobacterium sp.]